MKIPVSLKVREAVDEHSTPACSPIKPADAVAIASEIILLLILNGHEAQGALWQFLTIGAIVQDEMRAELWAAKEKLPIDPSEVPLINGLIRHIEWHGNRERGPGWHV